MSLKASACQPLLRGNNAERRLAMRHLKFARIDLNVVVSEWEEEKEEEAEWEEEKEEEAEWEEEKEEEAEWEEEKEEEAEWEEEEEEEAERGLAMRWLWRNAAAFKFQISYG
jgi:hypothetical protein